MIAFAWHSGQAQSLEALLQRAQMEQSNGQYAAAADSYAAATARNPSSAELWANRGVMEYLAARFDHSSNSLRRSLRIKPGLFTPLLFLGKLNLQQNKPDLAMPYLNRAHMERPHDIEVLLSIGEASEKLKESRQAAAVYAEASLLAAAEPRVWFSLGVASLSLIESDGRELATAQQSVWSNALYADELFSQGRTVEASERYRTAISIASPTETASLSRTLEMVLQHPQLFPLSPNARYAVQQLSADIANHQDAHMEIGCGPAPGQVRTLVKEAACAYWDEHIEDSADAAGKALQQSPHDPEALYWSIKANERRAVTALARFELLAPQSPATFDMVGDLYRHQDQADKALGEYQKALLVDSHDSSALLGIAAANLAQADPTKAAEFAKRGLADRPKDPLLNQLMAEALIAQQQFSAARPFLETCIAVTSEVPLAVHAMLGQVDAEEGKTEEAIQQFEISLPNDRDGRLHYQISRLYRKVGRIKDAEMAEAGAKALAHQGLVNASIAMRESMGTSH